MPQSHQQTAFLGEVVMEESAALFALSQPPLVRFCLIRFSAESHAIVIAAPRIVCDAESLHLLWADLFRLYEFETSGLAASVLASCGQFHEFACWQSDRLFTSYFDDAVAYWRSQWASFGRSQLSLDDLAWAHRAGAQSDGIASTEWVCTSSQTTCAVHELCAKIAVSPFVIFLSGYFLLLREATHRQHIPIWITCANRRRDNTDDTVGWLSNLHILGLTCADAWTGFDLIEACRSRVVEVQKHEELSLPQLWYKLGRQYERPGGELVLFDWSEEPPPIAVGSIEFERAPLRGRRAVLRTGFTIRVAQGADAFTLSALFASSRFASERVQAALLRYRDLVDTLATRPDSRLPELS